MRSSMLIRETRELHEIFLSALGGYVQAHSNPARKPLELDLKPPMPPRVRAYLYTATHPPGGRTVGEHKIQLIVPGQARGESTSFDTSGGRMVLLVGYEPEHQVFVLWDAGLYPKFTYSRNVQVRAETVFAAVAGDIGKQSRRLREGQEETILTAQRANLADAISLRVELTIERLLRG